MIRVLRLVLHVFGRSSPIEPDIDIWEKYVEPIGMTEPNPLLLQYQDGRYGLTVHYFFSVRSIKDGVVEYWPFATDEKLRFGDELKKWGFAKNEDHIHLRDT